MNGWSTDATAVNRRYWDATAAVHGNGSDAD
jgi:hypothetical protein